MEVARMSLPSRIDLVIRWEKETDKISFYSLYRHEIEEILMNYCCDQVLLFTYFHEEILKEWIWDIFCREPNEIIVDEIIYN